MVHQSMHWLTLTGLEYAAELAATNKDGALGYFFFPFLSLPGALYSSLRLPPWDTGAALPSDSSRPANRLRNLAMRPSSDTDVTEAPCMPGSQHVDK